MTSYCPQTRFAQDPDKWWGGESTRYATPEEAQASLAEFIKRRLAPDDLIETRIAESTHKPTHVWRFDKGEAEERGQKNRQDKPKNYRKGY